MYMYMKMNSENDQDQIRLRLTENINICWVSRNQELLTPYQTESFVTDRSEPDKFGVH